MNGVIRKEPRQWRQQNLGQKQPRKSWRRMGTVMRKVSPNRSLLVTRRRWQKVVIAGVWPRYREREESSGSGAATITSRTAHCTQLTAHHTLPIAQRRIC